jgi:FMN phosphatase YigB (HAD superfamily)
MFTCSTSRANVSTRAEFAAPRLLALDVGGVLVESFPVADWAQNFATIVIEDARRGLPDASPSPLPPIEQVAADLLRGRTQHDAWKDADSTGNELSQTALWALLSEPAWGAALLDHVARHRPRLTTDLCLAWEQRELRTGIPRLLEHCCNTGIAVCVVSNTISGAAYRSILERAGLGECFVGFAFSDEAGVRKPDPRLLLHGIHAAGATPAETWYVGDTYRRDVSCGRRAGVANTVLMRSRRTESKPVAGPPPGAVVNDPDELLALMQSANRRGTYP